MVDALGPTGFAFFALVTTLPLLLPLNDLGTGAAIVEAMGKRSADDHRDLHGTIITSARLLSCAGILSALVGIVPACFGVWSTVLNSGAQRSGEVSVAVAFTLFGCSLPLNLGNSVLIALNRTHIALLFQMLGSVLTLGLVVLSGVVHAPSTAFIVSGFAAQCLVGAACLLWAGRILGLPLLGMVLGSLDTRHTPTRIWHLAGPMAVINAALAVAYSTDRLVLVHTVDSDAVAAYSAGARLFAPAVALASATGLPLWTVFARQRGTSGRPHARHVARHVARLTLYFAVGGAILGAGLIFFGPAVASWMLHGKVEVGTGLMAAFAALLLVQSASYPASMWLTDAAGLKYQAQRAGVMALVNLALSIVLARHLGASGPVIGSVVAVMTCLFLPNLRRSMSHA
ncbi:lipopolysaccharide biosynthesis protein [Streptomyces sp. NPDC020192]|uniref:lipopolysaccharide biosynthesis protein n=1 Tax=Streptomyces sp. NPDC020192 TaxID=3365066 RepID=UPI0037A5BBBE